MNELFLEKKSLRLDEMFNRKDLDKKIFIIFDTETSGLFRMERGSKNKSLKQILPPQIKKELMKFFMDNIPENDIPKAIAIDKKISYFLKEKDRRNEMDYKTKQRYAMFKIKEIERKSKDKVQLAEIAAIAINMNGDILGQFHSYVKIDKTRIAEDLLRMIHWNDEKDSSGIEVTKVLHDFASFISKYNGAILIAHNAPFDAALLSRLSRDHGVNSLFTLIKSSQIVDSRRNTKIREVLKNLPTQTFNVGRGGSGKKTIEDNKLVNLQKHLNVVNSAQHSALGDVKALKDVILKLFKMYNELK